MTRTWRPRGNRVLPLMISLFTPLVGRDVQAQTVMGEITGPLTGAFFGEDVSACPDIDGDGFRDLIVGEPAYDPGSQPGTGRIWVYSSCTGNALVSVVGPMAGAGLGSLVGDPGDLTGDGIPEFAARVYGPPPLPFSQPTRFVEVFSVSGALLAVLPGDSGAVIGDITGDGIPELAVGDMEWTSPSCPQDEGRVYAVSAAAGAPPLQWTGFNCIFEDLGFEVATLGDLLGDGLPDFAVTSQGNYLAGTLSYLGVYSGTSQSFLWFLFTESGPIDFGRAGDVDLDGVEDVIAGCFLNGPVPLDPTEPGIAYIVSGASGQVLHLLVGPPSSRFGLAVCGLGDLDGDGHSDVLIGAPRRYPWDPSAPPQPPPLPWIGRAYVYSGQTGQPLVSLAEPPPFEAFGSAVEALGDRTGDGYPDFAVSEPWRVAPNPGRVLLYSGAPLGTVAYGSGCGGSGGGPPRIASWPAAQPGSTIRISVSQTMGGTNAALLLGLSNTDWYGIPLPLPLGFLGMPGCELLTSIDLVVVERTLGTAPVPGRATVEVAIPSSSAVVGATIYAQWYVQGPGPGPIPGEMTRGLAMTVVP